MSTIYIFWPGDYRPTPNEWALPQVTEATGQLEAALKKLGHQPRRVEGFLTKPHESLNKLGPIEDPQIGLFCHWAYGPHTAEGTIGKDAPLLLASNFSGTWPGLVALLNTSACLYTVDREHSRLWTSAPDWTQDQQFMDRLAAWCATGKIDYRTDELREAPSISPEAETRAETVAGQFRQRRALGLMLGVVSMGMVNGYFGYRLLNQHGFTEHIVDQAWILDRMKRIEDRRVEDAYRFVVVKGLQFHFREADAQDFDEAAAKTQLRMYLTVLDLVKEFEADCIGWQYQLGLLPLVPPSDLCEGLFNSICRPESDGEPIICATEADQGNMLPMEMMKRLLKEKGLHPGVMFHDVRWGAEHEGRWLWVLLNSGSCGAYAFNHDPNSLRGVHSYRQPAGYFPVPGGTFAGESLPGELTWARSYLRDGALWMDVGRGECVTLPPEVRDAWWNGTTRQWPFMAADMFCSPETVMAHYMSNHVAVAYGDIFEEMCALSRKMGFRVRVMAG